MARGTVYVPRPLCCVRTVRVVVVVLTVEALGRPVSEGLPRGVPGVQASCRATPFYLVCVVPGGPGLGPGPQYPAVSPHVGL